MIKYLRHIKLKAMELGLGQLTILGIGISIPILVLMLGVLSMRSELKKVQLQATLLESRGEYYESTIHSFQDSISHLRECLNSKKSWTAFAKYARLRGAVTDADGTKIAKAIVRVNDRQIPVDKEGFFDYTFYHPNNGTVLINMEKESFPEKSISVNLEPGEVMDLQLIMDSTK